MASEILGVPEDLLVEVVAIIRAGLRETEAPKTSRGQRARRLLAKWCCEEEEYIRRCDDEDAEG